MSFQDLQTHNAAGKPSSRSSSSPSQAAAASMFQINTAVASFRRLADAIGTSKDTPDHRHKLHNTRQRILQLVKETSAKLKSLSDSDRSVGVDASRRIEDAKLARDFQTTLQEFQKVQQLASERESTYSPSAPPSSSVAISSSEEHLTTTMEQENQPFLMGQKRQEILLLGNEIAFNEAIIEEREQGIKEIHDQIGEASEIFKDLAVLVHEQGVVIGISAKQTRRFHLHPMTFNIEASSGTTTQARVQLYRASKSGKSKSSWCWWVLAILVIVLIIVLLVLIL